MPVFELVPELEPVHELEVAPCSEPELEPVPVLELVLGVDQCSKLNTSVGYPWYRARRREAAPSESCDEKS